MPTRRIESDDSQKFINPHRLFYGVWLPHWLECRLEVSERAKKLYAHLTYFAGDKGYAWPTLNTLAEKLHVSRRHVIRLVKELTHHGLISVTNVNRPGKGSCANYYRFLWHPWMDDLHGHSIRPDHKETLRLGVSENPGNTPISSVGPGGDIDATPPGDIGVTPRVTPTSPKEINRKRLNKTPKGASSSSATPQEGLNTSNGDKPPCDEVSSNPVGRKSCSVRMAKIPDSSESSPTRKGAGSRSAALRPKGWSIARRLEGEFWENCKVKPNLGILSSFAIRALEGGFSEADIVSAFERALHECHAHATDSGQLWEASSTVHRAERLLKQYTNGRETSEMEMRMERSSDDTEGEGKAEATDHRGATVREKETSSNALQKWPSSMEVRVAFNAIRKAAGLPEKSMNSTASEASHGDQINGVSATASTRQHLTSPKPVSKNA